MDANIFVKDRAWPDLEVTQYSNSSTGVKIPINSEDADAELSLLPPPSPDPARTVLPSPVSSSDINFCSLPSSFPDHSAGWCVVSNQNGGALTAGSSAVVDWMVTCIFEQDGRVNGLNQMMQTVDRRLEHRGHLVHHDEMTKQWQQHKQVYLPEQYLRCFCP